jgi:hypothetical protein
LSLNTLRAPIRHPANQALAVSTTAPVSLRSSESSSARRSRPYLTASPSKPEQVLRAGTKRKAWRKIVADARPGYD